MKRHTSRNTDRDAKAKPPRNEDSGAVLRARSEEERRQRRRDWMIEQEKMDRHNRLKKKMAMEYEIRRARNMSLALPEGRCNRPRRSRSESPPSRYRRTFTHHTPEDTVLSKKFETPSGTTPLIKGSEGTKMNPIDLCKIKVNIHRNIPGRVATNELKRDILNKEDVVLKRRAGEGAKPIFDREDIKRAIGETEEVEKHRSVVTVNLEISGMTILRMKIQEVTEVMGRQIIVENGSRVRDLTETIESGPEITVETGGKRIDPEKEICLEMRFSESVILNHFRFLFIMQILNRDHYWLDRGSQFEDLLEVIYILL